MEAVGHLSAHSKAAGKKGDRVACLPLFRQLATHATEEPAAADSLLQAGLEVLKHAKSSKRNSEENKVIRLVHYFVLHYAHVLPAGTLEAAVRLLQGSDLTDTQLQTRQLSALRVLISVQMLAGQDAASRRSAWSTLEPWMAALSRGTAKDAKKKSERKEAALIQLTAPVVFACARECFEGGPSPASSRVQPCLDGLASEAPDTAHQAALAALEACRAAVAAPTAGAGAESASSTWFAAKLAAAHSDGAINVSNPSTAAAVCQAASVLLSGHSRWPSLSGADDPAATIVHAAATGESHGGAGSPLLIGSLLAASTPSGAAPLAAGREALVPVLEAFIEDSRWRVALEAMRCLCRCGWSTMNALDGLLGLVVVRLKAALIEVSLSVKRDVPQLPLLAAACRTVVAFGEAHVAWAVTAAASAPAKAAAVDTVSGLVEPLLELFACTGRLCRLQILRALVWVLPSSPSSPAATTALDRVAAVFHDPAAVLRTDFAAFTEMLATRACFSHALLPVVFATVLAWFHNDCQSLPEAHFLGLATLGLRFGVRGRRASLSAVFNLLDTEPSDTSPPAVDAASRLQHSALWFLGHHAALFAGDDAVPGGDTPWLRDPGGACTGLRSAQLRLLYAASTGDLATQAVARGALEAGWPRADR